ncbi:MAG: hypothetical protein JW955_21565 [Sedimentisphaerales bacterium]|nr:hypothetical protein [Sedimentisphaerales bacterium]
MASFRSHQSAVAICLIVVVLGLCIPARAVQFAGGTGEPNDPYQIATAEDLRAVSRLDWSAHYRLMCDINLSGMLWATAPIPMFQGVFDGAGFTISNLHVQGGDHLGLFGVIDKEAVVMRVSLESADIRGSQGSWHAGLLVGDNRGMLFDCRASGQITGDLYCQYVGGLAGSNSGSIWCCSSDGDVTVGDNGRAIGGLVGGNDARILDCCTTCNIIGGMDSNEVGGLAGSYLFHLTRNTGDNVIIVGADPHEISFSYAAGRVSCGPGSNRVGGLVGFRERGPVCQCFWDLETTGLADSSGGSGLTITQMRSTQPFLDAGWDFLGERKNGVADLWFMGADSGRPKLTFLAADCILASLPGRGTPDAPYEIASAENLAAIRHLSPLASYRLVRDISMAGITWSEAIVPEFCGRLDGAGFAITGLTIRGWKFLGLCGRTGENASIKDLDFIDANVVGNEQTVFAGAVAGMNLGRIRACQVTGFVAGGSSIGALVGSNRYATGAIQQCRAMATVAGLGDSSRVGGLAGENGGTIRGSCSHSIVSGENNVGGLVGDDRASGIVGCYSMGEVEGRSRAGGLVGFFEGIGHGTLVHCYSTAKISGLGDAQLLGGLVGYHWFGASRISRCFWDVETSGINVTSGGGTGLSTAAMQRLKTYLEAGWDFVGESSNGTGNTWIMPSNGGYPELAAFSDEAGRLELAGSGTVDDPYQIAMAKDLGAVAQLESRAHFRIVADIDLAGIKWTESPIPDFEGRLDGNRHTILNLMVREGDPEMRGGGSYGLFGRIGPAGVVTDLYLKGANICAGYRLGVGALAGRNCGRVLRCMANGTVSAGPDSQRLGGLIGWNEGRGIIEESFAAVEVARRSGIYIAGGLCAENYGLIRNCYATSSVEGNRFIGGLVGWNEGTVDTCYAAGLISSYRREQIGGLVGFLDTYQADGMVEQSFWDVEASGQQASDGGTGLPTGRMQTARTFQDAGWDFETVWSICEGKDYPRLRWEQVECQ